MTQQLLLEKLRDTWETVISNCRNAEAASLLYTAKPIVAVYDGTITQIILETRYPFHKNRMLDPKISLAIRQALAATLYRLDNRGAIALDVRVAGDDVPQQAKDVRVARRSTARRSAGGRGGVRSIPTVYKGIQFRSRLEATTAELLDHDRIKLQWMYEEEGFDLDNVWYLPDFWLPDNRVVLEVKGILDSLSDVKVRRLARVCEPHGIVVMLLHNPRKRVIRDYPGLYVAGNLALPGEIITDSVLLVRCPHCARAAWKVSQERTCPLCGHRARSPYDFEAA